MFSNFANLYESFKVSHRVVSALNSGQKPNSKDLRKLGVREDRVKSDFL